MNTTTREHWPAHRDGTPTTNTSGITRDFAGYHAACTCGWATSSPRRGVAYDRQTRHLNGDRLTDLAGIAALVSLIAFTLLSVAVCLLGWPR